MAPKREIVDPAYDTLALSESDDDLDSEEIEDAPVCDDPHAALRRVSSAFDAKVAHLTSPGLAPPDATAVTLDAEVTSTLNAARAMLSHSRSPSRMTTSTPRRSRTRPSATTHTPR